MPNSDSNQVESAEDAQHAPRVMSWDDFATWLDRMEREHANFTFTVKKHNSGGVEMYKRR